MDKKYLSLIPGLSILALVSHTAFAVPAEMPGARAGTGVNPDKWAEQSQKWLEKWNSQVANETPEVKKEKVCNATQKRMTERWDKYVTGRTNRADNLAKGVEKLKSLSVKFAAKGLVVTELNNDITTLEGLVADYNTAFNTFMTALQKAKDMPCANYQKEFLPQLKAAKYEWTKVKAAAVKIRDFYQSDIKPDLQALRVQLDKEISEDSEKVEE